MYLILAIKPNCSEDQHMTYYIQRIIYVKYNVKCKKKQWENVCGCVCV